MAHRVWTPDDICGCAPLSKRKDADWPERCTLQGCLHPRMRPHHHHMLYGHLSIRPCVCADIAQPGTRP